MRSLLVVLSFLTFWFVGNAQIINFPDANFKNALVNTKCVDTNGDLTGDADADLNNDGEIDVSEALMVKTLVITKQNIISLTGIKNFINLEYLDCSTNKIDSIDLKGLSYFTYLNCSTNLLISLDLQGLVNFTNIDCSNNKLTFLNILGLSNLMTLDCPVNKLTSLNVEGLTSLTTFSCAANKITSLNVQGLTNLVTFNCYSNELTSINIQGLSKLKSFDCSRNKLTSLNVQGLLNLKSLNCLINLLTSLNVNELTNLTSLNCSLNQIVTLEIKGLINLEELFCANNQIVTLDIKGLINLKELFCANNLITSLETQEIMRINKLYCETNKIESLDLKGLVNLEYLNCRDNKIARIEINGLDILYDFDCSENELTDLNIKDVPKLHRINCANNLLKNLDVNKLPKLRSLYASNNLLETLDLNGVYLVYLDLDNNVSLISLFVKSNHGFLEHDAILLKNNFKLSYICIDEYNIDNLKVYYPFLRNNCEVNSYCNFTPGGQYSTIIGEAKFDKNNDGCNNLTSDWPYLKYQINRNNNIVGFYVGDSNGNYTIPIQSGTHVITPILENLEHFEVKPLSLQVTFPFTSDTITQNFCITPKGILHQTNITVIPLTPPSRPGFEASYKIVWENVGNQIENGTLNFTYDEKVLDYISATSIADIVADGIVKWNFSDLRPFEKREIIVTLKVNRPTDTPAVNAGDKLYLTASIVDNIFTLENTVVGSYDPNDKTCLQGERIHPDHIGKFVDFLIRFENTGNYAAENVVVKDIIDTNKFDVSSLQITDASHEMFTRIEGNKVEFIFENIQLPFDDANNDGYIAFKIKTLPTLMVGDSLKNLADIYFDYNFPIRTNETKSKLAFPVSTYDIESDIKIYPNPVRDILYLETDENWTKAEIYDISGRIIRSITLNGFSLDVSGLESGSYTIKLLKIGKISTEKFVKL